MMIALLFSLFLYFRGHIDTLHATLKGLMVSWFSLSPVLLPHYMLLTVRQLPVPFSLYYIGLGTLFTISLQK